MKAHWKRLVFFCLSPLLFFACGPQNVSKVYVKRPSVGEAAGNPASGPLRPGGVATPEQLVDAFFLELPVKDYGLRRLTRSEIQTEVKRITDLDIKFEPIALELSPGSHATISSQLSVSDFNKAKELARAVTEVASRTSPTKIVPCPTTDGPDSACVVSNLRKAAERTLRQSLSDSAWKKLHDAYKAERSRKGHDFASRAFLQDLLLSPRFLYLFEKSPEGTSGAAQLAARASFFLTGRGLNEPAQDGMTKRQYEELIDKLIASKEAGEGLARMVSYWFGMGSLSLSAKPVEAKGLNSALEQQMWTEFRMLTEDVLLTKQSPLADLFTADYSFMNGQIAKLYGIPMADTAAFQKVEFQDKPRKGILTTPAVLFSNSKEQGRSPMQRGKFLTLNLLCHRFPEGAIAQMLLPEGAREIPSLREQFRLLEKGQPCSSCHTMLGSGFAFDRFDPMGREYIQSIVPDSDLITEYTAPGREELKFKGPVEAVEVLSALEDLPRCFTKRAFEFALGREAGLEDKETLEGLYASFKAEGFKVVPLLKAITTSPQFLANTNLK